MAYKQQNLPQYAQISLVPPSAVLSDTTFIAAALDTDGNNFQTNLANVMSKTYLKKACCSGVNYIKIPYYDTTQPENYGLNYIIPIDLSSVCQNLDGDGITYTPLDQTVAKMTTLPPGMTKCANFSKTYCHTLKTVHPRDPVYNRYSLLSTSSPDKGSGLECGCMNSDITSVIKTPVVNESTIPCVDGNCSSKNAWKTESQYGICPPIVICQQDIDVTAGGKVDISGVKFSQQCGATASTTTQVSGGLQTPGVTTPGGDTTPVVTTPGGATTTTSTSTTDTSTSGTQVTQTGQQTPPPAAPSDSSTALFPAYVVWIILGILLLFIIIMIFRSVKSQKSKKKKSTKRYNV